MKMNRIVGLLLLLAALTSSIPVSAADTVVYDETRLTTLYDAYLKKNSTDAYLEKRIRDERARLRTQADEEVKEIVASESSGDAGEETALPKALDRQRTVVNALEERVSEHNVDLNLLKEEEDRYYTEGSPAITPNDEFRLTKTYPELLARKAILEERIAAIETALPLQRDRQGRLQRDQIFEQFAFLFGVLSYVGIVLLGVLIDRILRRMLVGRIEEKGRRYLIAKVLSGVIYAITALWIMSKLFSDHPGALASLAIVGAGIAVALQDVVKDVVGWMIIVHRRLFTLGDRVSIGIHTGDVIDVGLMRTAMLEVSAAGAFNAHERTGKTLYVPNSLVLREPVLNYNTTSDFMSVEMLVTVTYESGWQRAETILLETLDTQTAEFAEQARRQQRRRTALFFTAWEVSPPEVHMDLASSGILFTLKFTVPIGRRRSVVTSLTKAILEHFDAHSDIDIAFNTIRVVGGDSLHTKA